MDLDRLEQIARGVKTRAELEQLKANVLGRGGNEAAKLVNDILLERFPLHVKATSGATPTEVRLLARTEFFDSGKEAYLWLVEQFRVLQPLALEKYLELQSRGSTRAKGRRFAKTTEELFPPGSARALKASHYAPLSSGWFADVNLDHKDKFGHAAQARLRMRLELPN